MIVAHICDVIGYILNVKLKINPFNVKVQGLFCGRIVVLLEGFQCLDAMYSANRLDE
jgi:hypothetical protein